MFSRPNTNTGNDEIFGIQWNAQTSDYSNPSFPRFSQISGTHTFVEPRERVQDMTDETVINWMVEEGFNKQDIESRLQELI